MMWSDEFWTFEYAECIGKVPAEDGDAFLFTLVDP